MNQLENQRHPPPTWRYIDWIGGREEFDKMFAEYPPELKAISERTIMCADIIDGVMQCFWDLPEEFPAWVKKHYPHLTCEQIKFHNTQSFSEPIAEAFTESMLNFTGNL